MLSRIAESLFWIGRYLERADDTARILDVHLHLLLEDPYLPESLACAGLLGVMGVPVVDGSRSIAGRCSTRSPSTRRARARSRVPRRGARERPAGPRDRLVRALGVPQHHLDRPAGRRAAARRRRTSSSLGARACRARGRDRRLDDEPDDAWRFLVLGRSLERADMTARLVAPGGDHRRSGRVVDAAAILRRLRELPAHLPRRRVGRPGRRVPAARPAVPALGAARADPGRGVPGRVDPVAGPGGREDRARRVLGRARTAWSSVDRGDHRDLPAQMERVQRACSAASDAVSRRYFPRP